MCVTQPHETARQLTFLGQNLPYFSKEKPNLQCKDVCFNSEDRINYYEPSNQGNHPLVQVELSCLGGRGSHFHEKCCTTGCGLGHFTSAYHWKIQDFAVILLQESFVRSIDRSIDQSINQSNWSIDHTSSQASRTGPTSDAQEINFFSMWGALGETQGGFLGEIEWD